jgi:hypothetical protein
MSVCHPDRLAYEHSKLCRPCWGIASADATLARPPYKHFASQHAAVDVPTECGKCHSETLTRYERRMSCYMCGWDVFLVAERPEGVLA